MLECSGSFKDRATAERHLQAGAARLLFSQPAEADVDATVVYGVNQSMLTAAMRVVSAASCTTNCLVPILHVLDRHFGVEHGVTTTIHSAMNDQPVIDAYHNSDLRLTRSAMQSIVPVDSGLARGIGRLMPHLAERFECLHVRVPTINVSAMDMAISLARETDAAAVNACLRDASLGCYQGLLGYTDEPMASVDFNHDPRSGIVDATQTRVAGAACSRRCAGSTTSGASPIACSTSPTTGSSAHPPLPPLPARFCTKSRRAKARQGKKWRKERSLWA